MENCGRKKLLEALKNIYDACPDSSRVIVVRCEKCANYEAESNFCRYWIHETSHDGYCHEGTQQSSAFEKTYLEDYMEKNPDEKCIYGYPTVYPCDEYRELYDDCEGDCRKCWNKRMIAKED